MGWLKNKYITIFFKNYITAPWRSFGGIVVVMTALVK